MSSVLLLADHHTAFDLRGVANLHRGTNVGLHAPAVHISNGTAVHVASPAIASCNSHSPRVR